ncbi:hypothetical protein [Oerskovia turbata]
MTGSTADERHDDLFDRLRDAADAVPPSTLDLPVVLIRSRRKAAARRVYNATTALAAVVVLGIGVAIVAPGHRDAPYAPAAPYEVVTAESVLEDVAPGITAVAQAATYERADGTVVLDTGIETGAHGDRFLVVVSVRLKVGGNRDTSRQPGEESEHAITVDPATGLPRDIYDPAYVQHVAELGYPPIEERSVQVVAGDEGELERLRRGGAPRAIVVSAVGSIALVDNGGERLVFGVANQQAGPEVADLPIPAWNSFEGADGMGTYLDAPLLAVPGQEFAMFALALDDEAAFEPRTEVKIADEGQASTGECSVTVGSCAVAYDASARHATPSQVEDPRWTAYAAAYPQESIVVEDPEGAARLYWCDADLSSVASGFAEDLSERQVDVVVEATADLNLCKVERASDGKLRVE